MKLGPGWQRLERNLYSPFCGYTMYNKSTHGFVVVQNSDFPEDDLRVLIETSSF